jgi:DNA-directed RNA polymerase subunit RPC12/RpoP
MGIIEKVLNRAGYHKATPVVLDGGLQKSFEMLTASKTNVGLLTGVEVRDGCFHRIQPAFHLMNISRSVWIVKACNNKIASEVTKFGWDFAPNFSYKCRVCEMEYDHKPEDMTCECGSTDLVEPDATQLKRVKALFKTPNVDSGNGAVRKPMKEMLKDSTVYLLSIADWYWTIHRNEEGVPIALDVCPSEYIKECVNDAIYFCPFCAADRRFEVVKGSKVQQRCRVHSTPLVEAGYIQVDENGKTLMAWQRKDILHGQVDAYGNRKVGESRLMALIKECQTINWTGMYIWSSLSMSKRPGKLVAFEGMNQEQVNEMLAAVYKFKAEHPEIQRDLWLGNPNGAPTVLDMMGEMNDASLTALRGALAEEIALTYGISMSFLGKPVAGKLGNPEDLMEVSTATVCEVQQGLGSFINNQVLSQFREITDWHFELTPPTKEDKKAEAEWKQMQAQTLQTLRAAQIDAILNDDFEIVIRGELPMTPVAQPFGGVDSAPSLPPSPRADASEPPASEDEMGDDDDDEEVAKSGRKCSCQHDYTGVNNAVGATRKADELALGTQVEMEHTDDPKEAARIAGEHIAEDPQYYSKLQAAGLGKMFYKGITPRNNPEFVRGAATLEREFSADANRILASAAQRVAKGAPTSEAEGEVNRELNKAAEKYVKALIKLSYDDENGGMGIKASAFDQVDENALQVLMQGPQGMLESIKSTSREVVLELYKNVAEATARPGSYNFQDLTAHLAQVAGNNLWKMERIVRSETTKLSNHGRAMSWEKSDPDGRFTLSVSHSPGVPPCKTCKAIADMGPLTLDDLKKATNNLLPHPNCKCTVVRVTSLSRGGV